MDTPSSLLEKFKAMSPMGKLFVIGGGLVGGLALYSVYNNMTANASSQANANGALNTSGSGGIVDTTGSVNQPPWVGTLIGDLNTFTNKLNTAPTSTAPSPIPSPSPTAPSSGLQAHPILGTHIPSPRLGGVIHPIIHGGSSQWRVPHPIHIMQPTRHITIAHPVRHVFQPIQFPISKVLISKQTPTAPVVQGNAGGHIFQ